MKKHLWIAAVMSFVLAASFGQSQSTTTQKEAPMTTHATGPFDVKMLPQDDKTTDGITRMLLDKQYHGDLEGTAKGQMLTGGISASSCESRLGRILRSPVCLTTHCSPLTPVCSWD